ncbi:MAG: YceI family protein [Flavobacteriales bacterium]|nr:YceI family protein [Flavobacteriales bacterium]
MKTHRILPITLALAPLALSAQERFATRNGHIAFLSETAMENIAADNRKVTSVFDATTGAIEFAVLIKAFEFEKALMQEHFNENYMESNTFPKATFKGKITGVGEDEMKKEGTYMVSAQGDLTIHGVTKPVTVKGTLTVDAAGAVKASGEFTIKPEDHGIKIPGVVRDNIAEQVKVTVKLDYAKM